MSSTEDQTSPQQNDGQVRRSPRYEAPRLRLLGSLTEITLGSGGLADEGSLGKPGSVGQM